MKHIVVTLRKRFPSLSIESRRRGWASRWMNITYTKFKDWVKTTSPFLFKVLSKVRRFFYIMESPKSKFTKVYRSGGFGGQESLSGFGSDLIPTTTIREQLPLLFEALNVRILLDAPCGDFYWMGKIKLRLEKYIGVDIVSELIQRNREKYGNEIREFRCIDLRKDKLPAVDLILCRDCLAHLSFKDIFMVLRNFKKSDSKYLLATHHPTKTINEDTVTGFWRTLNFLLPPFDFPESLYTINEKCTEQNGELADKSLALWRLEDLKL